MFMPPNDVGEGAVDVMKEPPSTRSGLSSGGGGGGEVENESVSGEELGDVHV